MFYNPQGNSDVCENEIVLFHVVLKWPFGIMEKMPSSAVLES